MFIKSVFLRAVSVFITLVLLIFVGSSGTGEYDVKDPSACKLNFTVASDVHVEGNNFSRYKVFARSLRDIKKNKSGNDAVLFLGDNTMNGQLLENMLFHGAVATLLPKEKVITVVGNHDIGNGQGDYAKLQDRWFTFTKAFFGRDLDHPYFYEVIDGCYFIVLGSEAQLVYEMKITDEQFDWLEGVLDLAAKSGKPAFVFSHHPTDDVVDENDEPTERLVEMLAEYNREHDLFAFVGHTHMPLFLFWSFHNSDGYPETYLPRLTHLAGENDDEIYEESGIALEVELYENELVIRGRDLYRGEWRFDKYDEKPCEVTYQLKNPVK